jgi:hypothetical protein
MAANTRDELFIWTIYTRDTGYVAKSFLITPTGPEITTDEMVTGDLEIIRNTFRTMGLYPLGRQQGDAPDIIESWI